MNANVLPFTTSPTSNDDVRQSPTLGEIKRRIAATKRATAQIKKRAALLAKLSAAVDEMCDASRHLGAAEEKAGI